MMFVHHVIAVSDHISAVAATVALPAKTKRAVLRCTTSSIELRALLGDPNQVGRSVLDLAIVCQWLASQLSFLNQSDFSSPLTTIRLSICCEYSKSSDIKIKFTMSDSTQVIPEILLSVRVNQL
jgi:hypothetical protein